MAKKTNRPISDKTTDAVLSSTGHLISLAARRFARLSEKRLKPYGFGVGQIPVLMKLRNGETQTQRQLAQFARIEQPPMAQMIARMERDGLVRRERDPNDRRASQIRLTDEAVRRLPDAVSIVFDGNREALAGFSEAEVTTLTKLLGRLIQNLDDISRDTAEQESRGH